MRLTHLLTVPAAAGAIILLGMSSASAGEVSGNGKPTQGLAHANSICASPAWRTARGRSVRARRAPQNWGHVRHLGELGRPRPSRANSPVTRATGTAASCGGGGERALTGPTA